MGSRSPLSRKARLLLWLLTPLVYWVCSLLPQAEGVNYAIGTVAAVAAIAGGAATAAKAGYDISQAENAESGGYGGFAGNDLQPLFQGPQYAQDLLNALFGSGSGQQQVADYLLHPIKTTGLEHAGYNLAHQLMGFPVSTTDKKGKSKTKLKGPIPSLTEGGFGESYQALRGIIPIAQDLAQTGFKTDIQPAIDLAKLLFTQDFLPEAANYFSGITGLGSSDFGAAVAREAQRSATELAALDIQLSEAAAGRRVQGIPLLASAAVAPTSFGLNVASDIGNLGEAYRLRRESTRPGARLFGALQTLTNLETSQRFFQPGYPLTSEYAGQMGNYAAAIPGLLSGVGGLVTGLGGLFGGSTSVGTTTPPFNPGAGTGSYFGFDPSGGNIFSYGGPTGSYFPTTTSPGIVSGTGALPDFIAL
jgi:hypothetical protein